MDANTVCTSWDKLTRDEKCNSNWTVLAWSSSVTHAQKKQNSQTNPVSKRKDHYETGWHPWGKAFKFVALLVTHVHNQDGKTRG